MIYISTDYVFDGEKGNYSIKDLVNPISKYAKTKTAAEFLVRTIEEFLIIRTSFLAMNFLMIKQQMISGVPKTILM